MEKEFVPYAPSLRLKALGFDEPCFGYYKYDELIIEGRYKNSDHGFSISAPTFSQAFRWFREKHDLFSSEVYDRGLNNGKIPVIHSYSFRILNLNNFEDFYGKIFNTYEEAELDCLEKLLEIVESKSK
jgi:hypothetical protein